MSRFLALWTFAFCIRVGEAAHPGPVDSESFVLGTANPSGLAGKSLALLELNQGIWNFSETQCTEWGFQRVSRELRAFQSPGRRLSVVHGAYANPRVGSKTAGTWTGVAQMADCPLRPLSVPWRGFEYISGRAMVSQFQLGSNSVLGASVYGPPRGPTYGNPKQQTAQILNTLTEELVLGAVGPRFIAGDMNLPADALEVFSHWRSLGWEEVQAYGLSALQRQPTPTCKSSTAPDHIWASPELLPWISKVEVLEEVFADHDPLVAHLSVPDFVRWQYSWHQPALLPWDHVSQSLDFASQQTFDWSLDSQCPTQQFKRWSSLAENELLQGLSKHVPIHQGFVGRGQTFQVVKKPLNWKPVAPGRPGDAQPRSSFLGKLVHLWFKQLRRLQAYLRRATSTSSSPSLLADQCCTWRSICCASGFKPCFASWWSQRSIRIHGSPDLLPQHPPDAATAHFLFLDFEKNFRSLERWHLAQRTKILQAKNHQHCKQLYQQLKPQKASAVNFLQVTQTAIVTAAEDTCVHLDKDLSPPCAATWTLHNLPVDPPQTLAPDQLLFASDLDLIPLAGHEVTCTATVSDFPAMENQFFNLWQPIWQRHDGLVAAHWDRIVAFGCAFLPPGPCVPSSWSAPRLQCSIQAYKKHAARGPDSWGRLDLLGLSSVRLGDLAQLFAELESGSPWPEQLVTGFVCPVPKCSQPVAASQYRPIVLISLLYRIWASASAKAFLPQLLSGVSPHIFGYVPHRRASDVWSLIQLALEMATETQQPITGYCADIIKCFNRLPRSPLFRLLRHFGMDSGVILAWSNALSQLARRFKLHSDVGPPRFSSTGFPEGDPLSCVAMLAFNRVLDVYVKQYAPQCIPFSFVDNIQLVSALPGDLQPGILVLQTFMDAWDLSLDSGKPYAWAPQASHRAALKAFGNVVRLSCKDLGAQMHYSQKLSKAVFKERLASVAHCWTFLRHSRAAPWFKRLVIRTALFPKLLHACEASWIPFSTLDTLRSKCMIALGWDRAGASPIIRWSLMQPLGADPSFAQVWLVLTSFRRLVALFPFVQEAWVATALEHTTRVGILATMHAALDFLQWTLDDQWILTPEWFQVSWFQLSLEELRLMAGHCWQQLMFQRVLHRKDFAGVSTVDVDISFSSFRVADMGASELVHTIQDGTFCTNVAFAKYDPTKPTLCVLCGHLDDLAHRCTSCPRFASVRALHADILQGWHARSRAFNEHGIVAMNPHLFPFWNLLLRLPYDEQGFLFLPSFGHFDVFTDGTCQHPHVASKRLAAWSVTCFSESKIIASGLLPGIYQTNDLAELFAVWVALRWAHCCGVSITLHCDNSHVVSGMCTLARLRAVPSHWKHQFLWSKILREINQLMPAQWSIHHVFSHGDSVLALTELEEWWIRGNDMADAAASQVFQCLPSQLRSTYDDLCRYHDEQSSLVKQQLSLLLEVAQHELHSRGPCDHDEEDLQISSLTLQRFPNEGLLFSQSPLEAIQNCDFRMLGGFSQTFSCSLMQFLSDLDLAASHARFVTCIELVAAFLTCANGAIPFQNLEDGNMVFMDPCLRAGGLVRHTFASAMKVLRLAIEKCFALASVQFEARSTSRADVGLLVPQWSLLIGWPDDIESKVSSVVSNWFQSRPHRRASDLARPIP